MADVKVDYKDVWNSVTDVASLLESNVSISMGDRAFVVPKGLSPMDLDWSNQADRHMWDRVRRTNGCSKYLWCDETRARVGIVWHSGGSYQGKGLYIHDAYMYAVVDSHTLGASLSASGKFSATPVMVGSSAYLEGEIHLASKQFRINNATYRWDFWIKGDGSGALTRR